MISLCIPTYNRSNFVISAFNKVMDDERISEIVISDDFSDESIFIELSKKLKEIGSDKIKIFRNESNKGAFINKYEAVKKASNEWVILLDSDNIIDINFIDNLPVTKNPNTLYLPCHAICESDQLDYREFSDVIIDMEEYMKLANSQVPKIQCLLNTGNYFFNRERYIEAVTNEKNLIESYGVDVWYLIYLWFKLKNSNKLKIVKDLKYHHTIHKGGSEELSHYIKTQSESSIALNKIIQLSNELRKI